MLTESRHDVAEGSDKDRQRKRVDRLHWSNATHLSRAGFKALVENALGGHLLLRAAVRGRYQKFSTLYFAEDVIFQVPDVVAPDMAR